MAQSFLTDCYETDCQWWQDGTTGRIVWYFVPDGTPGLPLQSVFDSSVWSQDLLGWEGVGEVWNAGFRNRKGDRVGDAAGVLPVTCGTPRQFLEGDPAPPAVPVETDAFGTLACCPKLTPPFVNYQCPACRNGLFSNWVLTTIGGDPLSAWGPALGSFQLNPEAACECESDPIALPGFPGGPFVWEFTATSPNSPRVELQQAGIGPFLWLSNGPTPWDCLSVRLCDVTFHNATPGWPTRVALEPGFLAPPPTACPGLATTGAAYYLRVPSQTSVIFYYLTPGTFQLLQEAPCRWVGVNGVSLGNAFWPTFRSDVRLSVDGGGNVFLGMVALGLFGAADFAEYTSFAPWDGASTIALALQTGQGFNTFWPDFVFIDPPLLP